MKNNFAIIIPSYNNAKWVEKNVLSALNQKYPHYKIIYIDDCSNDGTYNVISKINHPKKNKIQLIRNTERKGAMENLYHSIHSCDNEDIIVTLDGDDWLANDNVLRRLNREYNSGDVWMTWGQFQHFPGKSKGCSGPIPKDVIEESRFRRAGWKSSHLRTFKAWLFKQIKEEDLKYEGKFFWAAWDLGFMIPMLEMSGDRGRFIPDVLYIYNNKNPIQDHKVHRKQQLDLAKFIRGKKQYQYLKTKP